MTRSHASSSANLHAFKFDLATGRPVGNDCAALRIWPVELNAAGEMLLRLEERPRAASPACASPCSRRA